MGDGCLDSIVFDAGQLVVARAPATTATSNTAPPLLHHGTAPPTTATTTQHQYQQQSHHVNLQQHGFSSQQQQQQHSISFTNNSLQLLHNSLSGTDELASNSCAVSSQQLEDVNKSANNNIGSNTNKGLLLGAVDSAAMDQATMQQLLASSLLPQQQPLHVTSTPTTSTQQQHQQQHVTSAVAPFIIESSPVQSSKNISQCGPSVSQGLNTTAACQARDNVMQQFQIQPAEQQQQQYTGRSSSSCSSAAAVTSATFNHPQHSAPKLIVSSPTKTHQNISNLQHSQSQNIATTSNASNTSNYNNLSSIAGFTSLPNYSNTNNISSISNFSNVSLSTFNNMSNLSGVQLVNNHGQIISSASSGQFMSGGGQQMSSSHGISASGNNSSSQQQQLLQVQASQLLAPATAQVLGAQGLVASHNTASSVYVTPNTSMQHQHQLHTLQQQQQQQQQLVSVQQTSKAATGAASTYRNTSITSTSVGGNNNSSKSAVQALRSPGIGNNVLPQHGPCAVPTAAAVAGSGSVMLPVVGGGVMLSTSQHTALKPVIPGPGQLIQLLSTNNRLSTVVSTTPKLIQPKQPQLLPKPITCGLVAPTMQPQLCAGKPIVAPSRSIATTPPCSSSAMVSSGAGLVQQQNPTLMALSNQSLLGAAGTTVITSNGAGGAAASAGTGLILNGNLLQPGLQSLQAGLQQPILIQHANGMQFLLRPATGGTSPFIINSTPQFLLNTAPAGPPVSAATKNAAAATPQAIMIPGTNGQAPTFVVPQQLAQSLAAQNLTATASNLLSANNTRPVAPTQTPIFRFLTQQPPALQLQQINTPNGPSYIAVPSNTTLNLPAGAVLGGAVRQLAPHMQASTIQLAPSQQLQVSGQATLQLPSVSLAPTVMAPANGLSLSNSIPVASSKNAIEVSAHVASSTLVSQATVSAPVYTTQYQPIQQPQQNEQKKKKPKKKKKEKEPKETKARNSINLNDIMKETGIFGDFEFDENDFGPLPGEDVQLVNSQLGAGCSSNILVDNSANNSSILNNSSNNISLNNNIASLNLNNGASIASLNVNTGASITFNSLPVSSNNSILSPNNILPCSSQQQQQLTHNSVPMLSSMPPSSLATLLSMPSLSNSSAVLAVNPSSMSNVLTFASNSTTTSPSLVNDSIASASITNSSLGTGLFPSNVVNISGSTISPQFLSCKVGTLPSNGMVATVDAQGKFIFGSLSSLRQQIMPTSSNTQSTLLSTVSCLRNKTQSVL